jgi:hypothetical protein
MSLETRDEGFELLARLELARQHLASTTRKYEMYIEEPSNALGFVMVLSFLAILCFYASFKVWAERLGDDGSRTTVSLFLALIGVSLAGLAMLQQARKAHQRKVYRRLQAELDIARDLDVTLASAENHLESALEKGGY